MLRRSTVVLLACASTMATLETTRGDGPQAVDSGPAGDEALRLELLGRMGEDQEARNRLLELSNRPAKDDRALVKEELEEARRRLGEIDRKNTARLKQVVGEHGWPGKTLVGVDGALAAWLLVQHADRDPAFQKRCLPLVVDAAKAGEATPSQMALLTDRVRVADKQRQVYGTQFREVDGRMEPHPIEDEARVDERRRAVGLEPLAEYRKSIEALHKPKAP